MTATAAFGTVTDYATAQPVRPATVAEWRKTADKLAAGDCDSYTGAWDDEDGRVVYVDGGPDAGISDSDIAELEQAAANAGDSAQVSLCEAALEDDSDARRECVRVILDTRIEFAA